MAIWTGPAAADSGPRPRPRYRDPRVNRHRQASAYERPRSPAYPCQLKAITDRLITLGFTGRIERLLYISLVVRRRIPALQALSVADATAVLICAGIDGRSERDMP